MTQVHLRRTMRVFGKEKKNSSGNMNSAKNSRFQNVELIQPQELIYTLYCVPF